MAQKTAYAAVALDLILPDIDGLQLVDFLRAELTCKRLPIVVLSAISNQTQPDIKAGLPDVEWLAKPTEMSKFLAAMNRLTVTVNPAKARVLHVEDDLDMHQAVRGMAGQSFDFELATNLREARARVALERFEVVVLDLSLPNESGWDLLPDIRAQQPDARVVVLSDSELSPDQSRLVEVVLRKSEVLPSQLMRAIDVREFTEPKERGTK